MMRSPDRREVLRKLAKVALPAVWSAPFIEAIFLPVHAQMSTTTPFSGFPKFTTVPPTTVPPTTGLPFGPPR
jgi:hypothetical protein